MIFTVASALMYVKKRSLFEVVPDAVKKVWNDWELRGLILVSLILQIVLILLGRRRKYIGKYWIRFVLWSAYLTADWVATVALGVISNTALKDVTSPPDGGGGCNCNPKAPPALNKELMSFWAPFLLLHLGGPDTITAYSMEDNELWLRHLLGLVVQTGVAIYILLMSLPGESWLPFLSMPVLAAGIIKYGERTWALRLANTEHLRESLLTRPDPGPNYPKFMEEFTLKKAEGFHVKAAEVMEEAPVWTDHSNTTKGNELVLKAYDLFQIFKRLFVDLILSFHDRDNSQSFFEKQTPETAFEVIEVELGFAFDVLYTKAPVVYTPGGGLLRLTTFSSTFAVLVAFVFLCTHKYHYHPIDLIITYLLLVVAILLEIYAVFVMLHSDWTDHWLSKHERNRDFLLGSCLKKPKKRRWSNSMAQYNLLSFCLRDKPARWLGIQRLLMIDELREKHRYKTYNNVSPELKDLIFNYFKKLLSSSSTEDPSVLCTHKGSFALKEYNCTSLEGSTKVEFDQRILIWHIATDLCYYTEKKHGIGGGNTVETDSYREVSKQISDYMLYLLVMCPALLPIGIGMIRFRDTCAEAREFFGNELKLKPNACKKLLYVNTEVPPIKVKGDRSKSVLFDACRLAKSLRAMKEQKWGIVSHVWVEILAYAATHCRGQQHAQQLRKGGELLTHVWLLMAHLGITEQFQIKGHARAKMIVK